MQQEIPYFATKYHVFIILHYLIRDVNIFIGLD
jgi:hypothetical protein